jgi:hypothetical protein
MFFSDYSTLNKKNQVADYIFLEKNEKWASRPLLSAGSEKNYAN